MENTFSVGGVLKEAYAIMQPKFWKVIGQFLLIFFALQVLFIALFGRGAVIGSIITAYIGVKWALSYVRKGSFSFDCIFEHLTLKKFVYYVCAIFLVGLSVIGGFILLVIPGIIFATRLIFVKYLVIEKDLKPMAALRESKRITKGNRWKIFWFMIVICFVNVFGLLCLIVGIFFTAPLTALATALLYKKLSAHHAHAETAQA